MLDGEFENTETFDECKGTWTDVTNYDFQRKARRKYKTQVTSTQTCYANRKPPARALWPRTARAVYCTSPPPCL